MPTGAYKMIIDVKTVLTNGFIQFFDHIVWLVPIALSVAIYLFIFRREVAYDLNLNYREQRKLGEKSFMAIIVIIAATITYLYVKEYFLLLSITISFILTYFLYRVGILDMIVKWWEDK